MVPELVGYVIKIVIGEVDAVIANGRFKRVSERIAFRQGPDVYLKAAFIRGIISKHIHVDHTGDVISRVGGDICRASLHHIFFTAEKDHFDCFFKGGSRKGRYRFEKRGNAGAVIVCPGGQFQRIDIRQCHAAVIVCCI